MDFIKKNHFTSLVLGLLILIFGLMNFIFYFTNFQIVPDKLEIANQQLCSTHLDDKSYQIKQLILENINNSKLWVANRQNSFFDSRWFAISYYENNGHEWLLKDFKINPIALNVYKLNPSDYIKTDQTLVFPHPQSEQLQLQETSLAELPLLVMDVPNFLPNVTASHLVRIHLFSDIFASILDSNQKCRLNLLDNRGNFILNAKTGGSSDIVTQTKRIFKNLLVMATPDPARGFFRGAFSEIFVFNFFVLSILILILGQQIYLRWRGRIESVARGEFDMNHRDELSVIEDKISHK